MGRPPSNGAPAFRFNPAEVAQMEAILQEHRGQVPAKELLMALAEKFSKSPERAGKFTVQMKQVWNWFQNRRYALRAKSVKSPGKLNISSMPQEGVAAVRNVPPVAQQIPVSSGYNVVRKTTETTQMEFEAKSARDGAWYDVQAFLSHRYLETGNPEVQVRFAGFGPDEDEWLNVRKHVRQRSLPCEAAECVAILPGDLILCFQEGKDQALYFDAHILDAQRRRHDIRGCRCRFLVRYDHDQSEEIVPLRKVCRRPETDYRLQQLNAANEAPSASVSTDPQKPIIDPTSSKTERMNTSNPSANAVQIPALVPMSPAATAPASVPVSAHVPTPGPVPVSAPSSVSVSIPTPAAAPASVPIPVPSPTPTPAPAAPSPTPAPAPIPVSTPCSAQVAVPAQVIESNNNPVGACKEADVISPDARSIALDTKAGSTHMETAVSTGTLTPVSVSPVSEPEKIDASNLGHPEPAGTAAIVSTESIKD